MHRMRTLVASVVALGAVACGDILSYNNPNAPDKTLALSRPTDVENLIAGAYNTAYNAMHGPSSGGSTGNLGVQMLSASFESYSALGNYNMGVRAAMPRVMIDNSRGAPPSENPGSAYDYLRLERGARSAALGLQSLNKTGFTTGSLARDLRARAFGHFVKGYALGNLALSYDSGAVVTEYDDPAVVPPLVQYDSLMKAALFFLDSAITLANTSPVPAGPASDWFPLPQAWLFQTTPTSMTAANFVAFIRGLKARFRAEVARTPAERAAVAWASVVADGQAALGTDFIMGLNYGAGWGEAMIGNNNRYSSWAQANFFMLAFADTTHAGTTYQFDTWLATTPVYNRLPFLVQTPDKRFPAGATRALQNAVVASGPYSFPYYRNRPATQDNPGDPLTFGYYDHFRFLPTANATNEVGPWTYYTRAETNLLIAEGLIRQGQIAAALPYIDSTRVRAGLPALTGVIVDTTTRVPGGTACVPRIPDKAQSYKGTICGNVWEAMKYEMRLETAYTGWGEWFFHERGWGDLPEGTPVHWPVPYSEMDARVRPFYNMGGVGNLGGSARGTYGLWGGGLY